jgi:serine-type D-Ala-D-Ala carboxypeptidase (penicillin-binding protein 5/6)
MFAPLKSEIRVGDLLRGVIVQAANDACLVLAEGLAGGEPAFVERMTKLGAKIGLTSTHFANATGFSDPSQKTTARDLARMARFLIEAHPDIYAIYSEKEFTWNRIRQTNRNPLLSAGVGADGLSTGASEGGGYGLAASATRDGRRLILIIQGLDSVADRADEAKKLIEWGFSSFKDRQLFAQGEVVGTAVVFGGTSWTVPLVADKAITVPVRTDGPDQLEARILYDGPVPAPIEPNAPIGRLHIAREGAPALDVPLHAQLAVPRGSLARRAAGALYEMAIGLVRAPARTP